MFNLNIRFLNSFFFVCATTAFAGAGALGAADTFFTALFRFDDIGNGACHDQG